MQKLGRTVPAMAKPSRQQPSPVTPSAARGRRELSRRCLARQGEFRPRTAGRWAQRGHRREPALRQGRFFPPFFVATRKRSPAGARPANRRRPKATREPNSKDQPGPRPAPGRRIASECRARNGGAGRSVTMQTLARHGAGNGEAEPARCFAAHRSDEYRLDLELDAKQASHVGAYRLGDAPHISPRAPPRLTSTSACFS